MDKVYKMYKSSLMRSQHSIDDGDVQDTDGEFHGRGFIRKDTELTVDEKQYLLSVERGDVSTAKQYLSAANILHNININCTDTLGRTALLIAIENENIEMIEMLLSFNVETGDAILHAINEENVEAVELILNYLINKFGDESLLSIAPSSSFTPDITPIILAAHRDNYEIIKLLLDRGNTIPKPHDVRCSCKACVTMSNQDILRHSRSRINAYRALASPSLICLSSKDPILTAFELSCELKRLSRLENEFKGHYEELATMCQNFSVDLLEQTRGSKELEIILNHDSSITSQEPGVQLKLNRLKLAIKYKQKKFVTHPNCQQLLGSLWYEGLPGFRRQSMAWKLFITSSIGFLFPVLSIIYMLAPKCGIGQLLRSPFIKFICHSASYVTFLALLILVSQRVEIFQSDSNLLKRPSNNELRGALPTSVEWMILTYVVALIWSEIKQLWIEGAKEYIQDMWNILDFITNSLYLATVTLRVISYLQVQDEKRRNIPYATYQRLNWNAYDPTLISEVIFAAANIFSSLKLIHIFIVNSHLGPLQISLGRMVIDFLKFMFVFILVLFSFACGLNHLYWYYANQRQQQCDKNIFTSCDRRYKSFANLFEICQTLYWAIFGLIDLTHTHLTEPDEVKRKNENYHQFTEVAGMLFFGCYSFATIIVLLNMLIAMMSNSYQIIYSRADEEWKFARSKLWISYFDEGGTMPVPFNIIPSPKTIYYLLLWFKTKLCACSKKQKRNHWQSIKKIVKKINDKELKYQAVMRDLVKRYIVQKQRNHCRNEGVTEDDVNEIKQDVSSLRFELLEIFRTNGMKTPNVSQQQSTNLKMTRKRGSRMTMDTLKRSLSQTDCPLEESVIPPTLRQVRSQGSLPSVGLQDVCDSQFSRPLKSQSPPYVPYTIEEESTYEMNSFKKLAKQWSYSANNNKTTEQPNGKDVELIHVAVSKPLNRFKIDEGLGDSIDQQSERSADSSPRTARVVMDLSHTVTAVMIDEVSQSDNGNADTGNENSRVEIETNKNGENEENSEGKDKVLPTRKKDGLVKYSPREKPI